MLPLDPGTSSAQQWLAAMIFLVGPTGMFFLPFEAVGSFRVFYVFLFLFLLTTVPLTRSIHLANAASLLGLSTLMLVSAMLGASSPAPADLYALNPILRTIVIILLLVGFNQLMIRFFRHHPLDLLNKHLEYSTWGFLLVFLLGLALYLPAFLGGGDSHLYSRFISLEQSAYGYLRFNPGTYPNEFGVLSSFFAVLCGLLFLHRRGFRHLVMAGLFATGIVLSSTRMAYLTFTTGILYLFIFFITKRRLHVFLLTSGFMATAIFLLLHHWDFSAVHIVKTGLLALVIHEGSSQQRFSDLEEASGLFAKSPCWGLGFESPHISMLHNFPAQMLFGLGLIGLSLFLILLLANILTARALIFHSPLHVSAGQSPAAARFFRHARRLLIIHVVLFGISNHNQTHFLTWVLFMLLLVPNPSPQENPPIPTTEDRHLIP